MPPLPYNREEGTPMAAFFLWCILFIFCWPLAILALIAYPFVWLLLLPFRIVGIAVHGVLALVWAVVMLPARLLSAPFRLA
jgi:hypothetical protein